MPDPVFYDRKNWGWGTVATIPSPATTGGSLILTAGQGATRVPTTLPAFAAIYPATVEADPSTAEIVLVYARSTDTLSIIRQMDGSSARTVVAGDIVDFNVNDGLLSLIENAISSRCVITNVAKTVGFRATVADGVTNTTNTITSASAAFTSADVGQLITGSSDLPANVRIASVTNSTTAVLTAAATGTHTAQTFNIGEPIYRTYTMTSMSTSRDVTLCAASAVPAGFRIRIEEGSGVLAPGTAGGSAGAGVRIGIRAAGSDTVHHVADATNFECIRESYGWVVLESDGTSNWAIVGVYPVVRVEFYTANNTWRKPLTASKVKVRAIGGGGAGGSGEKQLTGTRGSGGGGGGPGGLTDVELPGSAFTSATESIVVGGGGTAGGTRSTTGNGADGGNGVASSLTVGGSTVAIYAAAGRGGTGGNSGFGGVGGAAGTATALGASHQNAVLASAAELGVAAVSGGTGAFGGTAGTTADSGTFSGPSGGGGGGGRSAANAEGAAGGGGVAGAGFGTGGWAVSGGTAGVNLSGAAGAGNAFSTVVAGTVGGGSGGGGGGSSRNDVATSGVIGGAGGAYGGGGGGGSAGFGTSGGAQTNGNGGAGAAGCVEITTYR